MRNEGNKLMADGPLAGVRILDLTQVISGPFCTQLLGDLGADVVKIESPEGDSMRRSGRPERSGFNAGFLNFNRNKRSIVIDIKKEHGRDLVRRLATRADAIVENNRSEERRVGKECRSRWSPY